MSLRNLGMEIIAALDLFYDLRLNAAVAVFQIFATQMIGYGIAGLCMASTFSSLPKLIDRNGSTNPPCVPYLVGVSSHLSLQRLLRHIFQRILSELHIRCQPSTVAALWRRS